MLTDKEIQDSIAKNSNPKTVHPLTALVNFGALQTEMLMQLVGLLVKLIDIQEQRLAMAIETKPNFAQYGGFMEKLMQGLSVIYPVGNDPALKEVFAPPLLVTIRLETGEEVTGQFVAYDFELANSDNEEVTDDAITNP